MHRKPIFDAVRHMLGRGFRSTEIQVLDSAIDRACTDAAEPTPLRLGPAGLALIKQWEGCARHCADGMIEAYPDPGTGGAPWTIGWGTTGPDIVPGLVWTQAQCDERLAQDLQRFVSEVTRTLDGAPTSPSQFDALVSFHYNTGAIAKAALARLHRAGDFAAAQSQFGRWIHAGGRVMRGLIARRAEEAALYGSA